MAIGATLLTITKMHCSTMNRYVWSIGCAICLVPAAQAAFPLYEIAFTSEPNRIIYGLNDSGSYLARVNGTLQLVTNGGNYAAHAALYYGVAEDNTCYGLTTISGFDRAAVWSPTIGWQVMSNGPLSSIAVGVTNTGKVLYQGNTETSGPPDDAGWWQIGGQPMALSASLFSIACDAQGNGLFNQYGQTVLGKVVRNNNSVINLRWNGTDSFATNMSRVGGRVCGQVGGLSGAQTREVVWDLNGNVIYSYARADVGATDKVFFSDVNAGGIAVGHVQIGSGSTAVLTGGMYIPAEGFVTMNSRLSAAYSGWNIVTCKTINSSGQIIAQAYAPGESQYRDVLLNPVPEPTSLIPLGLGLGATVLLRKRKRR